MDGLIAALRDPRAYPHAVDTVRLQETHISWVLLAGAFAYKLKKPVSLGFLDFSTPALRHHFCEEELRINRRFAPQLYLDVVPIILGPRGAQMGGEGEAVEYAVRMHRFADDALLAERAASLTPPVWRQLGADIARLQAGLPRPDPQDAEPRGVPPHLRDAIAQNFRQARTRVRDPADISRLNLLEERTWESWRLRERDLWRRFGAGYVREGHGDLHLGNIVMLEGRAVPFDAIEFNERLRWIDTANELAFLVMDCRARGLESGAWHALDAWLEQGGDFDGLGLLEFFICYRAMVRAKVALIGGATRAGVDPVALERYREYLMLAERAAAPRRRWLAITCGVSGSGKSTLAAALGVELGAIRIRADVERKRLFGLAPDADSRAAGVDIYTPEVGARTFARLAELAQQVLAAGYPVILDATFIRRRQRAEFRALAERLGVPFRVLGCHASSSELKQRVVARQGEGTDASEADLEVLAAQQGALEWPHAGDEPDVLDGGDGGQAARTALATALRSL